MKKEAIQLKDIKEGCMGWFEGRKERRKTMEAYNSLKNKRNDFKI